MFPEQDLFGQELDVKKKNIKRTHPDIWRILLSKNTPASYCDNYFKQQRGSLNRGNTDVNCKIDNEVTSIIVDYDLSHLYALNMNLNWLIRLLACYIANQDIFLPSERFDEITSFLKTKFTKLVNVLDFKKLFSEITYSKNEFLAQHTFVGQKNMNLLSMFCKATEIAIEKNATEPIGKAKQYLNSYMVSNTEHCHDESIIYLLSKQLKNKLVIQEAISRLERYMVKAKGLSLADNDPFGSISQANTLRLAGWKYLRWGTNFRLEYLEKYFIHRFQSPFTILRADLGIIERWQELEDVVIILQNKFEFLMQATEDLLSQNGQRISRQEITLAIASLYIFAFYRLNGKYGRRTIVDKAIDFILYNYHVLSKSHSSNTLHCNDQHITLTAMIVHAIAMAQIPDSQDILNNARNWLLDHQTIYGHWYQPKENPDYTTVLVLDALELAEGGKNITFQLYPQEQQIASQKPIGTSIHIHSEKVVVNPKSQNIQRKNRNKTTTRHEKKYIEWENNGDAKIIFKSNDRIVFYHAEREKDLRLKHGSVVHKFLLYLHERKYCEIKELSRNKEICRTEKMNPSEVVRTVNRTLNEKIRELGFTEIPENVLFVGLQRENNRYRFFIHTEEDYF